MIKKSMISLFLVGFISALLLFASACAPKTQKPVGPTDAEKQAQIDAEEAEKARIAAEEAEKARIAAEEAEKQRIADAQRMAEEAARDAMAAVESEKIYFDYDSSELKSEAQEILTKKAEWLKENDSYKLKIEGNCDDRGSTEYNMALGSRRAEAAKKFLNALGVSDDRIKTVSMGEENPAVQGKGEAVWSQNRRDEFELQ